VGVLEQCKNIKQCKTFVNCIVEAIKEDLAQVKEFLVL
jgi:hypothetical protein